jgi:hypothetical protein
MPRIETGQVHLKNSYGIRKKANVIFSFKFDFLEIFWFIWRHSALVFWWNVSFKIVITDQSIVYLVIKM